jgi:hypothetical protein
VAKGRREEMTKFYDKETSDRIFEESKKVSDELLKILAKSNRVSALSAIEMTFLIVAADARLHPKAMKDACDTIARNYEMNLYPEVLKRNKP